MKKNHSILYLIEFAIIGSGFALLLSYKMTFYSQMLTLLVILTIYTIIGIIHHGKHHDIHPKVVLEYILVSALMFALFVFLNISRI